jgi:hypothetical protein
MMSVTIIAKAASARTGRTTYLKKYFIPPPVSITSFRICHGIPTPGIYESMPEYV